MSPMKKSHDIHMETKFMYFCTSNKFIKHLVFFEANTIQIWLIMRKIGSFFLLFFICTALFPQTRSVEMPMLVPGYDNNEGVSATVGQIFDAMAPAGVPISLLTEGIQQGEQSACEDITEVTDVDNNTYPAVDLGLFCWTGQNLRTLRYANTVDVPDVMTYTAAGYSSSDLLEVFGHLYKWDAATQYNNGQGICPNGWHIPTESEMEYIIAAYDPEELMATTHWIPDVGTDITSFTLLPGGRYNSVLNRYEDLLVRAYLWTIKEDGSFAVACMFGAACSTTQFYSSERNNGYSVRCILDY